MHIYAANMENSLKFPQKTELPYDPAIPLQIHLFEENETPTKKVIYTPMFNAALFIITKTQKQPKVTYR